MGLRPIDPRVLALARDFGIEEQNFQWPADFIGQCIMTYKKHANVHYMLWLLLIIVITIIIYYLLFVIYDYYYYFFYYYY